MSDKWQQVACIECPGLKTEIARLRAEVKNAAYVVRHGTVGALKNIEPTA